MGRVVGVQKEFWCDMPKGKATCASLWVHQRQLARWSSVCFSEVGYFGASTVVSKQNVCLFEIAVNHVALLHVVQSLRNLQERCASRRFHIAFPFPPSILPRLHTPLTRMPRRSRFTRCTCRQMRHFQRQGVCIAARGYKVS